MSFLWEHKASLARTPVLGHSSSLLQNAPRERTVWTKEHQVIPFVLTDSLIVFIDKIIRSHGRLELSFFFPFFKRDFFLRQGEADREGGCQSACVCVSEWKRVPMAARRGQ